MRVSKCMASIFLLTFDVCYFFLFGKKSKMFLNGLVNY